MSHNEKRPRDARASSERVTDEKAEYASESSTLLTAAAELIASGLGTPLPLPAGQKYPPPKDTTGGRNPRPTDDEALARFDDLVGNVCLRVADGVIGIDVDIYGDKHGDQTMRAKVEQWGPLPDTYMSTSRDPETGSGIYYFRVPAGTKLRGEIRPAVEIIQAHHRYAVVWPSVVEGRAYRWFGPDLEPCDVPNVDDLPELPPKWVDGLKVTERRSRRAAVPEEWSAFVFSGEDVGPREWRRLVATLPGAKSAPCEHMADIGDPVSLHFAMRGNAYPTMNSLIWKAVRFGTGRAEDGCRGGCPGVYRAVMRIVEAYLTEVTPAGRRAREAGGRIPASSEATGEVTRSLTGAVRGAVVAR
ncbi:MULTISPECIES: bifunctional DNA primase/polymerase [Gordonia]|uniref:bifunctional DNA primase/polymerase n=1 Tax=Gordonia TaxID=2053 RepID=UPI00257E34B3|nr:MULTISPECIES: bifunctional DNA primase/polymerase [Gordonia]